MTALGDLLELIDSAAGSYRTVRMATVRRTVTPGLRAALERHAETLRRRGDSEEPWQLEHVRREVRPVVESRLRLWHAPPHRWRVEQPGGSLFVDDGEREWHFTPPDAAWTHRSQRATVWGIEQLLDPARLLPALLLEPTGETTWAGRHAIRVRSPSRGREDQLAYEQLTPGADAHELLVDAERGTVLRLASLLGGEEIVTLDVEEIAFDEEPAGWFVFEPPAGVEVVDAEAPRPEPQEMTLAEAAAHAPFTVLAPRRAPAGATLHVSYVDHGGPDDAQRVGLSYTFEPAAHWLVISQGSTDEWHGDEGWEEVRVAGRRILRRQMGGQRQLRAEHAGTHVSIVSDLDLGLLTELAASLEPVTPAA